MSEDDPRLQRMSKMVEGIVSSEGVTTSGRKRTLSENEKSSIELVESMDTDELKKLIKMAESKLLRREQQEKESEETDSEKLSSFLSNTKF